MRLRLLSLACCAAASASAFLPPPASHAPSSRGRSCSHLQMMKVEKCPASSSSPLNGLWRSLGLLGTAASVALLPGPLPTPAAGGGSAAGLGKLNEFLTSVRTVKEELQSEAKTDLRAVQRALDVEAVTTSVDATLDAQMGRMDQTSIIAKRKVVDKVLRQVLNDVVLVEDTLRDIPDRTGAARMKKVNKPLSKLEGDLVRLTSALTSEGDTASAAGLQKPLFSLCSDGYLLCEPE